MRTFSSRTPATNWGSLDCISNLARHERAAGVLWITAEFGYLPSELRLKCNVDQIERPKVKRNQLTARAVSAGAKIPQ